MNELKISPDFTIEDIHKIREFNYEKRKNMTRDEIEQDKLNTLDWFDREIRNRKEKRSAV